MSDTSTEQRQDAGNCPKCSRFHNRLVKPICHEKDCPIPEAHKGKE